MIAAVMKTAAPRDACPYQRFHSELVGESSAWAFACLPPDLAMSVCSYLVPQECGLARRSVNMNGEIYSREPAQTGLCCRGELPER